MKFKDCDYVIKDGDVHSATNNAAFLIRAAGRVQTFRVFEEAQEARAILFRFGIVPIDHPIELWALEWDTDYETHFLYRLISPDWNWRNQKKE